MFGLTCSLSLLSMTVRHHVLKHLDLNEDLVIKFLNHFYMDDSISGSDFSEKCLEFYFRMKTILKEWNFSLQNGFLIVLKLLIKKELIPSKNKSLARKFFILINFIKFWVFCGTLKLMNCSLI